MMLSIERRVWWRKNYSMAISVENIKNPPEKILLMYGAVLDLIKEQHDISKLTVSAITGRAGIGKGTAYEYFSSKEEIIMGAMVFEYSNKISELAKSVFEPELFKDRVYKIMDWISDNKEYNQMFTSIMDATVGKPGPKLMAEKCENGGVMEAIKSYILEMIDQFMEEGYAQGAFLQIDKNKRSFALLTMALQYSIVVMGPETSRMKALTDEELREFVYSSMIKSLE